MKNYIIENLIEKGINKEYFSFCFSCNSNFQSIYIYIGSEYHFFLIKQWKYVIYIILKKISIQ